LFNNINGLCINPDFWPWEVQKVSILYRCAGTLAD
jgi:hypothetical protein